MSRRRCWLRADLVEATRTHAKFVPGLSPRAALYSPPLAPGAFIDGRNMVLPEDVQSCPASPAPTACGSSTRGHVEIVQLIRTIPVV